ncbi:MAG: hypothetical protein NTZ64_15420 [Polaromonas sp.]|nr:hypothetical protein [Polaromonas sp.]
MIASISVFDELFESLLDGSSLTDEKKVFHAGVESAALLAANIESYLNDYINSTKVHHNNCSFNGETYLAYSDRKGRKPDITKSEFIKFQNHQANFFSYSFLKIINNINILSLTYDKKVFKRYNENLEAVKVQLLRILHILLRGIGGEIDAYEMCYTIREIRGLSDSYYKLDVERILKFDKNTSLNCLISRQFKNSNNIYYDVNRIVSIYSIINILEDIDNLKHRSEQLEKLDLSELTEISEIKKILFKNKS